MCAAAAALSKLINEISRTKELFCFLSALLWVLSDRLLIAQRCNPMGELSFSFFITKNSTSRWRVHFEPQISSLFQALISYDLLWPDLPDLMLIVYHRRSLSVHHVDHIFVIRALNCIKLFTSLLIFCLGIVSHSLGLPDIEVLERLERLFMHSALPVLLVANCNVNHIV